MAEMKSLLRAVYSRFKTGIAADMKGRITLSDQIISSRPLDQVCKLVFQPLNDAKTVFHRTPVGIPLLPYAGIKRELGWFDFTIGVVSETIADDCI